MKPNVRRGVIIAVLAFVVLGSHSAALDIDLVSVAAGPARDDGLFTRYFMGFSVEGSGIVAGTVFKDGSPLCNLIPTGKGLIAPEDWSCVVEAWSSLNDICLDVGFGDFTFEVTDSGAVTDTVTLAFDPCTGPCDCNDAFAEHAEISSPINGADIPPTPTDNTFCWECSTPTGCGAGDYFVTVKDANQQVVASEFLRGVSGPACWNPEICISSGFFSASAIAVTTDFAQQETDGGDPFLFGTAFESFNNVTFTVNTPAPPTPPGVPDGGGATSPMKVGKQPDGSTLSINWDAESCCSATNAHIVWGQGTGLPGTPGGTYTLGGSECAVGQDGTHIWTNVPDPVADLADPKRLLWWLVLANDDASTEGSWGTDSGGDERNGAGVAGSSLQCGIDDKNLLNTCGQ